jgi:hypothetical protein
LAGRSELGIATTINPGIYRFRFATLPMYSTIPTVESKKHIAVEEIQGLAAQRTRSQTG